MKIPFTAIASLAAVGGIIFAYEHFKNIFSNPTTAQAFATSHPNLAALAISLGFKSTTGSIPDVTGASGAQAESEAFNAVVNNQSQGFYNAALQEYAYDQGLDTSLDAQGTTSWPWKSYSAWVNAGYPALPGASVVTVDANGVYHNAYD